MGRKQQKPNLGEPEERPMTSSRPIAIPKPFQTREEWFRDWFERRRKKLSEVDLPPAK